MLEAFFKSGAICSLDSKKCLIGYGEYTWTNTPHQYPCWYAPDFFLQSENPYLHFTYTQEMTTRDLLKLLKEKSPTSQSFDPLNWECFEHFFEKFQQSALKKVVPYAVKHSQGNICIQDRLYHSLSYQIKNPHTYIYGFWNADEGMLGASPELIFSLDDTRTLRSDACAGTMPISLADTMLHDQKLMDEHQCVIEGLKGALSPFGELLIGRTDIVKFSKIAHLFTPIKIKDVPCTSINEIITRIHPSPAIGAFPKHEGMQYLSDYSKKVPRGRFGAPFGVFKSKDEARIYLAIRNIQWEKEKMKLMAGCGIVSESILQEEMKEIKHKFKAIHEIIGIIEKGTHHI